MDKYAKAVLTVIGVGLTFTPTKATDFEDIRQERCVAIEDRVVALNEQRELAAGGLQTEEAKSVQEEYDLALKKRNEALANRNRAADVEGDLEEKKLAIRVANMALELAELDLDTAERRRSKLENFESLSYYEDLIDVTLVQWATVCEQS